MADSIASTAGSQFERLVEIMARLRAADGCPWDREQTFDTIKAYLLEETYEVMDAIERRNWEDLADELGDLLLQAVFFAQMASEQGHFDIRDSLEAINAKLVRRHPHVFGDGSARTAEEVKKRWDEIKQEERAGRGEDSKPLLDGVPRNAPSLVEAQQISSKVARVGFDWPAIEQVIEKLHEELGELAEARQSDATGKLQEEIGDILFVVVNLARFLKVDAEQALRATNAKFRKRFGYLEERLMRAGRSLQDASLEEMEELWQEAKQR